MYRPIDYIATAESYGFRITTWAEFEAATDRPEGLLERALQFKDAHVLWDPDDGDEGFMLVGSDRQDLAERWFNDAFAAYPADHQIITYAS